MISLMQAFFNLIGQGNGLVKSGAIYGRPVLVLGVLAKV